MRPRQPLPYATKRRLHDQHGAILTAQLLDDGLSRRVCRRIARSWTRVVRGIYLVGEPSFEAAVWAGVLHAGPAGVVGSDAAAYLAGILRDPPTDIVVWTPERRSPFAIGDWNVRFRRGLKSGRGTPPRLSVEDSLLDLARDNDEVGVIEALARALTRRLTTHERVLTALAGRVRVRHARIIRELCLASETGIESGLEWLFQRDVIAAHRLPAPRRQIADGEGRIDCLYNEWGVIVELDGIRDHTDWSKDMLRDNAHALRLDAITLRYGWNAVTRQACTAAAQVAAALTARGWQGQLRRCPRCPTS